MNMIHIPIPEGLELPENAESEPFVAEVEFVAMDGMLMPISVAGIPLPESEMEDEEYEEEVDMEGAEEEMPEGEGGFMSAIEQALGRP
jgi:hypothetical protein